MTLHDVLKRVQIAVISESNSICSITVLNFCSTQECLAKERFAHHKREELLKEAQLALQEEQRCRAEAQVTVSCVNAATADLILFFPRVMSYAK